MTEVYALRYAYRTQSQRGEHFYGHVRDCCGTYPIDYFTWTIMDDDRTIAVDAGFTPETARERGSRPYVASPLDTLAELGRAADDVTDLVITHLHYDHTGFVGAYPNATVWLQRTEWEFWSSELADRGGFAHLRNDGDLAAIRALIDAGRVELIDGDADLGGGVTLHRVGGHTPGMQIVRIASTDRPVVLASDASHFYANIEGDHPYGVVFDLGDMYRAFDRLHELAGEDGVIVPGHDPLVLERHSPRSGAESRIIRLDA